MYLKSADNGLGLHQSFSWALARNNSSATGATDPLYCTSPGLTGCATPDDEAWSRVVLTSKTDSLVRPASSGNVAVDSTTSYTYTLQPWGLSCPGCGSYQGQGMYWRSSIDQDLADFYNDKFTGFAQARVANPDTSVAFHKYLTSDGIGVYDWWQVTCSTSSGPPTGGHCASAPWWRLANAGHGHEYEVDRYDGGGTTLLQQVKTRWRAVCPPPNVGPSPSLPGYGDQGGQRVSQLDAGTNPVTVCDVQRVQSDTYQLDGASTGTHSSVSYAYDQYGNVTNQTSVANATAADSSGHGVQAGISGGLTELVPGLVSGDTDTAVSLDGVTGAVETGYLQSAVNAYSVEAWIKTTDSGFRKAIVQDRGNGLGQSLTLGLYPATGAAGEPFFEVDSNNLEIGVFGTSAINDGLPHHLVGTWSGTSGAPLTPSQFHLYVDGVAVTTSTLVNGSVNAPVSGLGGTKIGRHDAWDTSLTGTVDEVAIYTTALTATRVQAHRNAGAGYKAAVLADSPAAYFRLDDGAAGPVGPNTIVSKPTYTTTDTVVATSTSATGTYIVDTPAFTDVEDVAGNRSQCTYDAYDSHGLLTTQDRYTACGSAPSFTPSGQIRATHAYDLFGNQVASADPDANAGIAGHLGCSVSGTSYSSCTTFDSVFATLPTRTTNALGQATTTGYLPTSLADSSGHGNSAVWTGKVGFGATGLVSGDADSSATLDGTTAYSMVPSAVFGSYPTSGTTNSYTLSFEAWFKTTSGGVILGQVGTTATPPGGGWVPAVYVDSAGALREDIFWHSGQNVAAGPYNDGQPHHVVATYSGGTDSLYVDGVLKATTTASETAYNSTYTYLLGDGYTQNWTGGNGGWEPFNGTLDEAAVYSTALSAARVQAHYTAGAGYRSAVLADAPTAYYRMDDGSVPAVNAGFGLWPLSRTDANGQTTSIGYDALGRQTSQTLPGETAGQATTSTSYTVWCAQTGAQTPCVEIDRTQRLNSTTTATSRAFYDGLGHLVETRSPAPGGQDIVRYSYYDTSQRLIQQSVPYLVTAYTGSPGSAAFAVPDASQSATKYDYDGLGRVKRTTDALSLRPRSRTRRSARRPAPATAAASSRR